MADSFRVIVTKPGYHHGKTGRVMRHDGPWREVLMFTGACWFLYSDLETIEGQS